MESEFEETAGRYYRAGLAKERGMRNQCRKKLVLFASNIDLLLKALYEASKSNDCYEVKVLKTPRDGVYCGISLYTNENSLGDAWARYESHGEIWSNIHDDEISDQFKDRVRKP